jgi:thiol-disulfide isomerase/thioredoxin
MPRFGATVGKVSGVVAAAALIVGGAAYYFYTVNTGPTPREVAFTDVTLTTETGDPIDLTSFADAPVVVVSWATWCPSCIDALAVASRAKEKYPELEVLAVNRKEEQMIIDDYREAYQMPSGIVYARDDIDKYFKNIIGTSMPEVLVYDRDGGLRAHLLAPPTDDELAQIIDPLFSE